MLQICRDALGRHISEFGGEAKELSWWEYRILKKTFPGARIYKIPMDGAAHFSYLFYVATLRTGIMTSVACQADHARESDANVTFHTWAQECDELGKYEISIKTGARLWDAEFGTVSLGARKGLGRYYVDLSAHALMGVMKDTVSIPQADFTQVSHKLFDCPDCKCQSRVPAGSGRIRIKCPHCTCQFVRET